MSLIEAVESGDLAKVKELVEAGADIHALDDCALRWASERGQLEVVKYLEHLIKIEVRVKRIKDHLGL